MSYRAKCENQPYDLTPELFHSFIDGGIDMFFGITFSDDEIISDEQTPEALDNWLEMN